MKPQEPKWDLGAVKSDLPSNYRDKTVDNVSYSFVGAVGDPVHRKETACYYGVLQRPGDWEVTCRPSYEQNSAPAENYQRFFRELKRCGLVHKTVKTSEVDGLNTLVLPRRGWGYHPVYVTLSMYRHADQQGRSILGTTMALYDHFHGAGTHFIQCLHWALTRSLHGLHHSCFPLSGKLGLYEGGDSVKNHNLRYSIAIAAYGKLTLAQKNALNGDSSISMIENLARKYKSIEIENLDECLDPKYARYYVDPKLARIP